MGLLLCEEYLTRHKLAVPLVKHTPKSCVFFQGDGGWLIQQSDWHGPDIHPGHYIFRVFRPVHNGFERGRLFEKISLPQQEIVQWDEYEPRLIEWANTSRAVPRNSDEVLLASWEILLRCWDKSLIRHVHMDALLRSLDKTASIKTRCQHMARCVEHFTAAGSECKSTWRGELENYRSTYAYWLAQLVKEA